MWCSASILLAKGDIMNTNFVAVGHIVHDVAPEGYIIGGAASYSSITVRNLGLNARAVTAVGGDFRQDNPLLEDIEISYKISDSTTTFHNIYESGKRRQFLLSVADKITAEDIPKEWQGAEIAYLCPVADEVDVSVADCFPNALIGATPQGWLRRWDESKRVSPKRWDTASEILPKVDVLVLSDEDIAAFPDELDKYIELTKIVVVTKGKNGAMLYQDGKIIDSSAYLIDEVEPTGAGDVFAAAFLMRYYQTRDVMETLNFAHCVASFAVELEGAKGIPTLEQVRRRLKF